MANELIKNRIKQTCAGSGTGDLDILSGAAVSGFRKVEDAYQVGESGIFVLESGVDWEIFYGTRTGAGVLSRQTVIESTNSNNKLILDGGTTHLVFCDLDASGYVYLGSDGIAKPGTAILRGSTVNTLTDLTALSSGLGAGDSGVIYLMLGNAAANDGGGGLFRWNGTGWDRLYIRKINKISTAAGGDPTPSVADVDVVVTTGSTAITNLLNGTVGQLVHIVRGSADIVLTHSASFDLGGSNVTLKSTNPTIAMLRVTEGSATIWKVASQIASITRAELASTATGAGAALIGIEDAGSLLTATTVEAALQELASATISLDTATLTTLKARAAGATGDIVYMRGRASEGDGGQGWFYWLAGDQSANVTLDPQAAIFVPPDSASSGASGCWKRDYVGEVWAEWFGAIGDADDAKATANTTALEAMYDFCGVFASRSAKIGAGDFRIEGMLLDTIRGVELDGQGTADASKTGTTIRWKSSSATDYMLDLRSTHSLVFRGIRFRAGTNTGKTCAIISTANADPLLSNLRTTFEDCLLQDDTSGGLSVAMADWKSAANSNFIRTQFSGAIGIRIGTDTDNAPTGAIGAGSPTIANGAATDIYFERCMFFADIDMQRAINVTFNTCYWEVRTGLTRVSKIYPSGAEQVRNITFINPIVTYVGSSVNVPIWYDGPTNASGNHGPLLVIGGMIHGADICFNLPDGIAEITGVKFLGQNTPTAAIALGANYLGDLETLQNNDYTDWVTAGSAVPITDARQAPKFADSDSTPSLAGSYAFTIADTPPIGGYSAFDDKVEGRTYIVHASSAASTKINNNSGIVCPGNQSFYVAPNDAPFLLKIMNSKAYVFPLGAQRKTMNAYAEQTATIVSGTLTPIGANIIIAGEGGTRDNLVNVNIDETDDWKYKPGAIIAAKINSVDEPITVMNTGNVSTWNGYDATLTDPNKNYFFRVNSDGLGMTLMPDGLNDIELYNEPLGANDVVIAWGYGQSNQHRGTQAGAASEPEGSGSAGAMTHVFMMATGSLAWTAFDTSGGSPWTHNCHLEETGTLTVSPSHSFAQNWEDRFTSDSLKPLYMAMAAQGGQSFSAYYASANASRWNPDRIKSQADGTPDVATDGYYSIRHDGETNATPPWSLFELAQQMIRQGLNAIEAAGKTPRILGVFMVHGEADSQSATTSAEYLVNLKRFHAACSAAAGVESIPMFNTLVRSQSASYTHASVVNAAIQQFTRQTKYAQYIDPQDFPNYDAGDTAGTPPNLGIFGDGVHYTQTTGNNWADAAYTKTIRRNFFGIISAKEAREAQDTRKVIFSAKYDAGTKDTSTREKITFNSIITDTAVKWNSTNGYYEIPYAGEYEITASMLSSDLSSNTPTSTELEIWKNDDPSGSPTSSNQLVRSFLGRLTAVTIDVDEGAPVSNVTVHVGAVKTMNVKYEGPLAAGDKIYLGNTGYRHTSSSTDADTRIQIKLLKAT